MARASAALAEVDIGDGRMDEAAARLEQALVELEQAGPSAELAVALAQLGRVRALSGHGEEAVAPLERALSLSERLMLPEVFVEALTSKGLALLVRGRLAEARILLEAASARAHAEQLFASALRSENNLGVVLECLDLMAEALDLCDRSAALARRRGDRRWESSLRTGGLIELFQLGRWDEATAVAAEELPLVTNEMTMGSLLSVALVHCERGEIDAARDLVRAGEGIRASANPQGLAGFAAVEARVLRAEGRHAEALAAAKRGLAVRLDLSITDATIKGSLVEAVTAALDLGDFEEAEALLSIPDSLDPGDRTPFLQASATRLRARLDAARGGGEGIGQRFRSAAGLFREFGFVFYLAVTQLEHGEWLVGEGRDTEAEPLLTQARETFERLRATPWLERLGTAGMRPVQSATP
jgi:tetratricopeptide (TPR) repeat protein